MKAIITLVAVPFLLATSLLAQSEPQPTPSQVVFMRGMNEKSLDVLKAELADKGIKITYDSVRVDGRGQLESLSFTVKDGTKSSYTASTDELKIDVPFGFEYTYDGKQSTVLGVGTLGKKK